MFSIRGDIVIDLMVLTFYNELADINLITKFFFISESSHLGITKSCARLRRLCV